MTGYDMLIDVDDRTRMMMTSGQQQQTQSVPTMTRPDYYTGSMFMILDCIVLMIA